jgi:hypothetical protein
MTVYPRSLSYEINNAVLCYVMCDPRNMSNQINICATEGAQEIGQKREEKDDERESDRRGREREEKGEERERERGEGRGEREREKKGEERGKGRECR